MSYTILDFDCHNHNAQYKQCRREKSSDTPEELDRVVIK